MLSADVRQLESGASIREQLLVYEKLTDNLQKSMHQAEERQSMILREANEVPL